MSGVSGVSRVVLIEDNPADVFLIREAIREKGLDVDLVHYSDGEEAWTNLSQPADPLLLPPSLILLDLNLPKTEGVSLLRQIREHPALAKVPVAVLTSSQSPIDEREVLQFGHTRFIHKAPTLDEFFEEVGTAVRDILGPTPVAGRD